MNIKRGGPGSGGVDNPNQAYTTTSVQPYTATTSPKAATSTATASSKVQTGAIIGGVAGGIGGLLLLAALVIWLMKRRQKKRISGKVGAVEHVTYASLNQSFGGVAFSNPDSHLSPPPLITRGPGVGNTSREASPSSSPFTTNSGDAFPPTYAESQASLSSSGSPVGRLNTSHQNLLPASVSPTNSLQQAPPPPMSVQPTGTASVLLPQFTRDTMGFPVESADSSSERGSIPGVPMLAPAPMHPSVHQDALERSVRQGLRTLSPESQEQDRTERGLRHSGVGRILSQEYMRESPVLGDRNPVRIRADGPKSPSSPRR